MAVSFNNLVEGQQYDRPHLAELWGYRGVQAIARGVITPAKTKFIILFVTEEKQSSETQYNDYLEDSCLHWEGETKHSSDNRIINSATNDDEIHLFHRKRHHSPFTYMGRIELEQHNRLVDSPSQFIFTLTSNEVKEEAGSYKAKAGVAADTSITVTEKNAIVKSRVGQGVFRDGLLRIWGGCAVTGYQRRSLLLASHIKPWKVSTNKERLDPYNGLLLQPTIDRLFDRGFVSFDRKGKLIKSQILTTDELACLGVTPESRLTKVHDSLQEYLKYHRDNEFEKSAD